MNYLTPVDLIILEVSIVMPILDKISQLVIRNDILKQYTMWNFYILLKYIIYKNEEILFFITCNFIFIFILFHSFFILQPELLDEMPRKMHISKTLFHLQNIFFHVIPPIYCLFQDLKPDYNIHMYCNSFLFIWILIIENGRFKLDGIYSLKSEYREKLLLLGVILNVVIPKNLIYIKMI
tara:strand:- start:8624 stop:9163 length:540 start_codon:yes stop_codon:yes gene_type:complete